MRTSVRRSLYLAEYWRAVRKHWIALMAGGFSVLISILQRLTEVFVPWLPIRTQLLQYIGNPNLWLIFAFCCVLLASYFAWRDQYAIVENAQAPAVIIKYKITFRRASSPAETDAQEFKARSSAYLIPIENLAGGTAYAVTVEPIVKDGITASFSTIDVLGVGKCNKLDCRIEWAEGVSNDGPIKLFEKERTTLELSDWLACDHRIAIPLYLTFLDHYENRFVAHCTLEYQSVGQLITVINAPAKRAKELRARG